MTTPPYSLFKTEGFARIRSANFCPRLPLGSPSSSSGRERSVSRSPPSPPRGNMIDANAGESRTFVLKHTEEGSRRRERAEKDRLSSPSSSSSNTLSLSPFFLARHIPASGCYTRYYTTCIYALSHGRGIHRKRGIEYEGKNSNNAKSLIDRPPPHRFLFISIHTARSFEDIFRQPNFGESPSRCHPAPWPLCIRAVLLGLAVL